MNVRRVSGVLRAGVVGLLVWIGSCSVMPRHALPEILGSRGRVIDLRDSKIRNAFEIGSWTQGLAYEDADAIRDALRARDLLGRGYSRASVAADLTGDGIVAGFDDADTLILANILRGASVDGTTVWLIRL